MTTEGGPRGDDEGSSSSSRSAHGADGAHSVPRILGSSFLIFTSLAFAFDAGEDLYDRYWLERLAPRTSLAAAADAQAAADAAAAADGPLTAEAVAEQQMRLKQAAAEANRRGSNVADGHQIDRVDVPLAGAAAAMVGRVRLRRGDASDAVQGLAKMAKNRRLAEYLLDFDVMDVMLDLGGAETALEALMMERIIEFLANVVAAAPDHEAVRKNLPRITAVVVRGLQARAPDTLNVSVRALVNLVEHVPDSSLALGRFYQTLLAIDRAFVSSDAHLHVTMNWPLYEIGRRCRHVRTVSVVHGTAGAIGNDKFMGIEDETWNALANETVPWTPSLATRHVLAAGAVGLVPAALTMSLAWVARPMALAAIFHHVWRDGHDQVERRARNDNQWRLGESAVYGGALSLATAAMAIPARSPMAIIFALPIAIAAHIGVNGGLASGL